MKASFSPQSQAGSVPLLLLEVHLPFAYEHTFIGVECRE